MARSPRRSGFVCHRRPADDGWPDARLGRLRLLRDLTPTLRRQDHTLLPYAARPSSPKGSAVLWRRRLALTIPLTGQTRPAIPFHADAAASTASRPTSVTIASAPHEERDGGSCKSDLGRLRSGIFFRKGLDRQIGDLPVGPINDLHPRHRRPDLRELAPEPLHARQRRGLFFVFRQAQADDIDPAAAEAARDQHDECRAPASAPSFGARSR